MTKELYRDLFQVTQLVGPAYLGKDRRLVQLNVGREWVQIPFGQFKRILEQILENMAEMEAENRDR